MVYAQENRPPVVILDNRYDIITSAMFMPSTMLLKRGDDEFADRHAEKAIQLYRIASNMNCMDAHMRIALKFSSISRKERIFHLSEAAKMGNSEALEYVLDELLFRANSLEYANPLLAYQIYKTAKSVNSKLFLYYEDEKVTTMKRCVEFGPFDANAFIEKYGIREKTENDPYFVWEIAEDVSRGGRFGIPDFKLVFQLICRGGCVPAELMGAVDRSYYYINHNLEFVFDICDYISSRTGQSYCESRYK